ncbi:MAG: hypothetical protein V1794_11455 [Candidatus Glassbacteria bacterium]
MLVGLQHFTDTNGRYLPVLAAYEKILAHNGLEFIRLRADQPDFFERVKECELFILRWGHYDSDRQLARAVLPVVETELGVKCFPDLRTAWPYDDKIRQWLLFRAHGLPMVETRVFWDRQEALAWAGTAAYPQVFKLAGGAGSTSVVLVESCSEAKNLIRRMFGRGLYPERFLHRGNLRWQFFDPVREIRRQAGNLLRRLRGIDPSPWWQIQKNYALFQRFLPGNAFDTRVTVVGGRVFAFRRLVRTCDFRASGSGRIDYDPAAIDRRCLRLALDISQKLGFYCMAYDFLFNQTGEPEVCEISYTFQSRAVRDCPGWWDSWLAWHEGSFWPEYLHLADLLNKPDLKCPELDY